MSLTITPTITSAGMDQKSSVGTGTGNASGGFADLVKGIAHDAIDTSKTADQASVAAVKGQISDLELVQVMTEAEISLQRFKTVYEVTKQSLDKILNMGI